MATATAELSMDLPNAEAPAQPKAKAKRRAPLVFAALLGIAAVAGGSYLALTWGAESTDNAQIEGHVLQIAARIPGQVERVLVDENQRVKKGDVLVQLDVSELEARVQAAQGDHEAASAMVLSAESSLDLTEVNTAAGLQEAQGGLVQAESGLTASRASMDQAKADRDAAASRLHLAQTEYERTLGLYKENVAAKAELDSREASYVQAKAQMAQATAHLQTMQASIRSSGGTIASAKGHLAIAKAGPRQVALATAALAQAKARQTQSAAALKLAQLNLTYAQVRAPFDGIVTKRSVEPGQLVGPEKALFAIIADHELWVVANFKEDQIAKMEAGQEVEITVDAFGHKKFKGEVESLANATGARFTLLPPDNSSGNFIKVTQRVPVRIRLIGDHSAELRVGMSADVTVATSKPGRMLDAQARLSADEK